jgi:hypothetical protein
VDGTPVESVPVSTTSEKITSLFPHRNRSGEIIGFKTTTEAYAACQIWEGPKRSQDGSVVLDAKGQPVLECLRVLVPPARNLASYKKQFGTAWKPDVEIPSDFRKVGQFVKGDIVKIPLDANGEILPSGYGSSHTMTYRLGSIKTNGQLEFVLAEFNKSGLEDSPWRTFMPFVQKKPSSPSLLATILRFNGLKC